MGASVIRRCPKTHRLEHWKRDANPLFYVCIPHGIQKHEKEIWYGYEGRTADIARQALHPAKGEGEKVGK